MRSTFFVSGTPATKGSWKVTRGRQLRPDNKRERPWANAVAWRAKAAHVDVATTAVLVEIALYFARPAKPTHAFPARNDVDKLARSVLDALTGVAWVDDQQVTRLVVTKQWADERGPGALIGIEAARGHGPSEMPRCRSRGVGSRARVGARSHSTP